MIFFNRYLFIYIVDVENANLHRDWTGGRLEYDTPEIC